MYRRVFIKLRGERTLAGVLHVRSTSLSAVYKQRTTSHEQRARSKEQPFSAELPGWPVVMTERLTIQAYDAHMNLVLGQVEENIHHVDVTEDGQPMQPRVEKRNMEMLFVRGDGVILVCHCFLRIGWGIG